MPPLRRIGLALLMLAVPRLAAAAGTDDDAVARSRARFVEGAALVERAQWAEALVAFEQSARLHPHPVTTYNVGACERALGRYTRARKALSAALQEHDDRGAPLAPTFAENARAFLDELERLLVRAEVTLSPADASLAIDGRPLEGDPGEPSLRVAGLAAPGPGTVQPSSFTLLIDPGNHLFTLSRKGYSDVIVNRDVRPGERPALAFELSRLPARLSVGSNRPGAAVALDGVDVGVVPVTLERPAGTYRLLVRQKDHVPYEAQLTVAAGEQVEIQAPLQPERPSLLRRWWFWTAIGVGVASVSVVTWALTRAPDPLDGGGLGTVFRAP